MWSVIAETAVQLRVVAPQNDNAHNYAAFVKKTGNMGSFIGQCQFPSALYTRVNKRKNKVISTVVLDRPSINVDYNQA